MTRPQIKVVIKEDIKHLLEELWVVEPEDVPCRILTIEVKMEIDNIPMLSKKDL